MATTIKFALFALWLSVTMGPAACAADPCETYCSDVAARCDGADDCDAQCERPRDDRCHECYRCASTQSVCDIAEGSPCFDDCSPCVGNAF